MYTRCPGCKAEIRFNLSADLGLIPDGYKHHIKCPNCGCQIAVKIPQSEIYKLRESQQTFTNPFAPQEEPKKEAATVAQVFVEEQPVEDQPVEEIEDVFEEEVVEEKPLTKKEQKKAASKNIKKGSCITRNIFMILFMSIFVVLSVGGYFAYLSLAETGEDIVMIAGIPFQGLSVFNGIPLWASIFTGNVDTFVTYFSLAGDALTLQSFVTGLTLVMGFAVFTLACLSILINFICLCTGKRYGRVGNLLISLVIAALVFFFFIMSDYLPLVANEFVAPGFVPFFTQYLGSSISNLYLSPVVSMGASALVVLTSLFSLGSKKKKVKKA